MIDWNDPAARARLADRIGPNAYQKAQAEHRQASILETVAGHAIRPAQSRFGRLFAVGDTDKAFSTLEQAKGYANANPTLDALTHEYEVWNDLNGLSLGSADEHLFDEDLTEQQRAFLAGFCERWEAAEAREREAYARKEMAQ